MPTLKNTFPLLLLLTLLSLTLTQTPPHLHKLPLQLTSNYVYYADLYLGSNQQNITVLIDTGSRTLAAFCSLCQKGCLPEQEFIVETSDTFMNVSCETVLKLNPESVGASAALRVCKNVCSRIPKGQEYYCKGQLNYGSSSLSSYLDYFLILDKVATQPNGLAVSSSFGCIYAENNFDTGIWGLSLGPENQFLDEIHRSDQRKNHTQAAKLFTICTSDNTAIMNIGGVDSTYHVGEGYRMRVNPGLSLWWNLHVQDIGRIVYENGNVTIREEKESFGVHGVILDSGTDFHILPNKLVQRLAKIAVQRCQMIQGCELTQPYEIFSQVFIIPEPDEYFNGEIIGFQIGGRLLETPFSNYFWNLGYGVWALAVVSAEQFNFQMSILGSIWMNNFDIVFDRHQFAITVFDITGCQPSSRRLQQEQDQYDLPVERGDRIDGADKIMRLKMKHQRGIEKMNKQKQQN